MTLTFPCFAVTLTISSDEDDGPGPNGEGSRRVSVSAGASTSTSQNDDDDFFSVPTKPTSSFGMGRKQRMADAVSMLITK